MNTNINTVTETKTDAAANSGNTAAETGIDPALLALLAMLWEAHTTSPAKPWSLAKICKRAGLSMSSLMRQMNRLDDAGLALTLERTEGNPAAALTDAGRELCAEIFADQPPTSDMRTVG